MSSASGIGARPRQPRINLNIGLDTLVDKAVRALGGAHDPKSVKASYVFVRNGELVWARMNEEKRLVITTLDKHALAVELDRIVDFGHFKDDHGNWVFTAQHPPDNVVQGVLRAREHLVAPLVGITEVPMCWTTMRTAGKSSLTFNNESRAALRGACCLPLLSLVPPCGMGSCADGATTREYGAEKPRLRSPGCARH